MRVLCCAVVFVLIDSAFLPGLAQNSTTDFSSSTSDVYNSTSTTEGITPEICISGLDPPLNESISVSTTNATLIWSTTQSHTDCYPSKLNVECLALWEENIDGWQWVQNRTTESYVNDTSNYTTIDIDGLSEFTNYTCIAVLVAINNDTSLPTEIEFRTLEEVSSPPLNLSVTERGSTYFSLQWNKPEKNPGVFMKYYIHVVTSRPNYNLTNNCTPHVYDEMNTTTEEKYVFLGAFPDYVYDVSVFVENSAGNGSEANITVTTDTAASEPPTRLEFGGSSLNVEENTFTQNISWHMPCDTNGDIDEFQIELDGYYFLDPSVTDKRTINITASDEEKYESEIKGLMPYSEYNIGIRANGATEIGKIYNVTLVTEENFPGPPILVNITEQGPTNFTVLWREPERKAGNITHYNILISSWGPMYDVDPVRCSSNETYSFRETVNGSITSFTFQEGFPYYQYEVSVSANTSRGSGNVSTTLVNTTSSTPEPPYDLIFNLTDGNIIGLISWRTPCYANGPIDHFSINIEGNYSEDGSSPTINNDSKRYEKNIYAYNYTTHLLEAYNYEVKVWLVLEDGTNGMWERTNLTTPDGYPGPPSIADITNIESMSFHILWNRPSSKKGRIIGYRINVISLGPLYQTSCQENIQDYNYTVDGNSSSFNFIQGDPYYNYSISIRAMTSRGFGNISNVEFVTTAQSIPENVQNVRHTVVNPTQEDYNACINIYFDQPCRMNGRFINYKLNLVGTRLNFNNHEENVTSNLNFFNCIPLRAEYDYQYRITTINDYYNNTTSPSTFVAPAGIPQFSNFIFYLNIQTETTNARITLNKEDFDNTNGNISYLALIVSERNETGGEFSSWQGDWPDINRDGYYQVTENWWYPFRDQDTVTYIIGNDQICNENYCNRQLESGKEYYLIVRLFTDKFYKNSPTFCFRTNDTSKLGVILGIIFGILAFAVLGVAGFLIWKKNLIKLPPLIYPRKSSVKPPPDTGTAIPIHKFSQYFKHLENNPDKLMEQYMLISEKSKEIASTHTTTIAELTENRRKNRYTNILPFDATRVKLLIDEDDEIGSDYINASYIKGYSGNVEYIATQGPLPTTCRDFWKMVIQENVSIIVMVTQFVEDNKEKCYKYFPNNHESMTIGDDMEVRCAMELHFGTYCVRTIQVKKDSTQVTVTHMQYLDWPDFNVPKGTDTMLQFCRQLRERLKIEEGCVIVHCSAGVGRTGTLIATDILIQSINAGKNIDIFNTVLDLRRQRMFMVQAQKQYVYIHNLIRDTLEQPESSGVFESVEPIFENESAIELKTDDDNLINKEKESQF